MEDWHLPIAVSSQTKGMWDVAADTELGTEFLHCCTILWN